MIGRCVRKGCPHAGEFRPVLVLAAPNGHPWRGVLGMLVCHDHKTPLPETYLNDRNWPALCEHYAEMWREALARGATNLRPVRGPERLLSRVEYIAHDALESSDFDAMIAQQRTGKPMEIPVFGAGAEEPAYRVALIRGKS